MKKKKKRILRSTGHHQMEQHAQNHSPSFRGEGGDRKNVWKNIKQKHLLFDKVCKFTHTRSSKNSRQDKYRETHTNTHYSRGLDDKESACNAGDQVQSLGCEDPLKREWQPTPVFLPGEYHGQRNLADYRPWGCKESNTTERLITAHSTPNWSWIQ